MKLKSNVVTFTLQTYTTKHKLLHTRVFFYLSFLCYPSYVYVSYQGGPGSSVDIATDQGLDVPGSNLATDQVEGFPESLQTTNSGGTTSISYKTARHTTPLASQVHHSLSSNDYGRGEDPPLIRRTDGRGEDPTSPPPTSHTENTGGTQRTH